MKVSWSAVCPHQVNSLAAGIRRGRSHSHRHAAIRRLAHLRDPGFHATLPLSTTHRNVPKPRWGILDRSRAMLLLDESGKAHSQDRLRAQGRAGRGAVCAGHGRCLATLTQEAGAWARIMSTTVDIGEPSDR